ncbi:hypothetical protein J2Y48_002071 [Mycoplana sp. BE70]|uniref:hypothetical protein n=1 Tax=Mycoplana sp. BE70 TaxID=2817775 RepID=UPI0028573993|nr:hypothetical protein [Mycoplana sp. BE70]MDR6756778.1 hypothetical protein [Mycoplana sp. BE70]
MSTFKVYQGNDEVAGSIIAATEFNGLYTPTIDPTKLFEEWIKKLINMGGGVRVTYGDNDWAVSFQSNKFIATDAAGTQYDLKLKGDDDNKNTKKVMMIKPGQKPELNDQYLANIVANIKAASQPQAMAYLLGTILLRRCR